MTKPYPYQLEGVRKIQRFGGRALLADQMGLGKSYQALAWAVEQDAFPIVIVCPASLKYNWERECKVHFNLRSEILHGTKNTRGNNRYIPTSTVNVWIVNYDILKAWSEFLSIMDPELVIVDECQYIKSLTAKRTKLVRELCEGVSHTIALSGTPLTNRPAELWPTLNLVRPDLFPSFYKFGHKYCAPKKKPWNWEFKGATNLDHLHARLKKHLMIRRLKKDVLKDLPSKSRFTVPMQISDPDEYQEAVDDFINWLKKNFGKRRARSAESAERMVKMGYLRRLTGRLKLPAVEEWVKEFLDESEDKLLLFGIHKAMLGELHEGYGDRLSVLVNGRVKALDRHRAVERFQNHDRCRIFIGNIQAAGVGLNLTAASTVAFAEMGWTPGEHSQAEDRAHRIGQKKHTSVYYLVGKGTIEEYLVELVQEKQRVLDDTLDGGGVEDSMDIWDQLCERLLEGGK